MVTHGVIHEHNNLWRAAFDVNKPLSLPELSIRTNKVESEFFFKSAI